MRGRDLSQRVGPSLVVVVGIAGVERVLVSVLAMSEGFRHTLASCGYEVSLFREFADHHDYTRSDIESLAAWAEKSTVAGVLCTHKDLVKLGLDRLGGKPLWAVRIGLDFLTGREAIDRALEAVTTAISKGK